MTCKLKMVKC